MAIDSNLEVELRALVDWINATLEDPIERVWLLVELKYKIPECSKYIEKHTSPITTSTQNQRNQLNHSAIKRPKLRLVSRSSINNEKE